MGQEYFGQLLEKRSPEQKLLTAALREESCDAPLWFGFPLTLREVAGISRIDLLRYLDQYRIGTRQLFAGNLLRQPYFQGRTYRLGGELSNTEVVMKQTFWLGVYPGLNEAMLEYVAERLETFFGINF